MRCLVLLEGQDLDESAVAIPVSQQEPMLGQLGQQRLDLDRIEAEQVALDAPGAVLEPTFSIRQRPEAGET
jgi:hypothetical protein